MKAYTAFSFLALAFCCAAAVEADTFGSGTNTFEIEFVTIGNPGNSADTTGSPNPAGSVPYEYRIGKFEISEDVIDKANTLGGLGLTYISRGADKPPIYIDWFEAAKFVNWLNGSTPAYKFVSGNFQLWQPGDAGYDPNNLYRNSLAKYVLPSMDEWYKAAYYDPSGVYYDYPTGSDTAPTPVVSGTTAGTAVYGQFSAPDREPDRARVVTFQHLDDPVRRLRVHARSHTVGVTIVTVLDQAQEPGAGRIVGPVFA